MRRSSTRAVISCLLMLLFPLNMLTGQSATAMLYTSGSTWVNGSAVPKSAAVFSGDLLQTRSDPTGPIAVIQSSGSSVMLLADSMVKFQGPEVEIEHGGVRVTTSRGLEAVAGTVIVKPQGTSLTEFQVVDVDGRVEISANKGDVTVQDDHGTTTVAQGQQTTRDDTSDTEKKKKRRRRAGGDTPAAAKGGIMNSTAAVAIGAAGIAGAAIWLTVDSEPPASPACRTNPCR